MTIELFDRTNKGRLAQLEDLLEECFPQAYGGDLARRQAELCMEEERLAIAALEGRGPDRLCGGHPPVRRHRVGAPPPGGHRLPPGPGRGQSPGGPAGAGGRRRGCLTLYLGTDDEFFQTSLSQGDLFEDTFQKLRDIRNLRRHPYEFYQKQGFQIVGVLPDVNGYGKPDIFMAKPLGRG